VVLHRVWGWNKNDTAVYKMRRVAVVRYGWFLECGSGSELAQLVMNLEGWVLSGVGAVRGVGLK